MAPRAPSGSCPPASWPARPAKLAVRRHPMVAHGPRDGGRGALRAPHAGTEPRPQRLRNSGRAPRRRGLATHDQQHGGQAGGRQSGARDELIHIGWVVAQCLPQAVGRPRAIGLQRAGLAPRSGSGPSQRPASVPAPSQAGRERRQRGQDLVRRLDQLRAVADQLVAAARHRVNRSSPGQGEDLAPGGRRLPGGDQRAGFQLRPRPPACPARAWRGCGCAPGNWLRRGGVPGGIC